MTKCVYAEHGMCQIATRLANRVVPLVEQACVHCQKDPVPMAINRVTASIASHAQRQAGVPIDKDLLHIASNTYHLPGHRVNRNIHKWLKRLRIDPPADCGCDGWVGKMNRWGVEGSLEHLDEIVDAVYENLKTTYLSAIAISVITKPLIRRVMTKWLSNARS